ELRQIPRIGGATTMAVGTREAEDDVDAVPRHELADLRPAPVALLEGEDGVAPFRRPGIVLTRCGHDVFHHPLLCCYYVAVFVHRSPRRFTAASANSGDKYLSRSGTGPVMLPCAL